MISAPAVYRERLNRRAFTSIYQVKFIRREVHSPTSAVPSVWYTLNESGGARVDLYGDNHLADANTVTAVPGMRSNGAQFTAANQEYLVCTPDGNLQVPNVGSFTVVCWAWLDSKTTTRTIASQYNDITTEKAWRLTYDQPTDRIKFETWSFDSLGTRAVSSTTLGAPSTGAFYFIACRSSTVNGLTLNVNTTTDTNPTLPMFVLTSGTVPFRLGAQGDTAGNPTLYHDGRIDEFGFYRSAISDADVALLLNQGQGVSPLTISLGYNISSSLAQDGEAIGIELLAPTELIRQVEPETGRFPLTKLLFDLIDYGDQATLVVSANIIGAICEFYTGIYDLVWQGTSVLLFTGIVTDVQYLFGRYRVTAQSRLTAAQDKIIFNGAASRLTTAINSSDSTLALLDASSFENAAATPQNAVRVCMVENEIMAYRGKSGNSLTSVQRPGTNGYLVPPYTGPHGGGSTTHAAGVEVRELPKLGTLTSTNANYGSTDLHPIAHFKAVFQEPGKSGIAEAGIPLNSTLLADVQTRLGPNVQMRFLFGNGLNGKKFLEEDLVLSVAAYPIENTAGELGLKLFQAGSAATILSTVTDADIIEPPQWLRNAQRIVTTVVIHYDHMPITDEYQSAFTYRDDTLVAQLGREVILEIFSKGIRSFSQNAAIPPTQAWFGETAAFLLARAQAYVDRFGGVSPVIAVTAIWPTHLLECGDDIEATFSEVPNLPAATRALTNAKMEVIASRLDFVNHLVELELFGYPVL